MAQLNWIQTTLLGVLAVGILILAGALLWVLRDRRRRFAPSEMDELE